MKKTVLNLALIVAVVFATSCKNEAKTENADTTTEKVEETKEEKKEEKKEETAATNVPSFSNEKVQEYVKAYEAYIAEYRKAAESKNVTALGALGEKGQELATKSQELTANLSGDDVQKFTEYMMAKGKELQELSNKFSE
ncbi:hypothetical protein ACFSTE_18470 [Aquimarina hainanensis]|uniref:Lipoprotein n=1 Tax=Aquimarina hainanensis TaxID=1578017 RepID=A0ABW5ND96_9FLAO|nr:hypothetical protein [Aquimarina sp. TRL1]QKX06683.1 hypothetical protein HN014_17760 [Aquimarina sp. TRL1]